MTIWVLFGSKMVTLMPCNYLSAPRCGLIDKMIEQKVLKTSFKHNFTHFFFLFSICSPCVYGAIILSTSISPPSCSHSFLSLFTFLSTTFWFFVFRYTNFIPNKLNIFLVVFYLSNWNKTKRISRPFCPIEPPSVESARRYRTQNTKMTKSKNIKKINDTQKHKH